MRKGYSGSNAVIPPNFSLEFKQNVFLPWISISSCYLLDYSNIKLLDIVEEWMNLKHCVLFLLQLMCSVVFKLKEVGRVRIFKRDNLLLLCTQNGEEKLGKNCVMDFSVFVTHKKIEAPNYTIAVGSLHKKIVCSYYIITKTRMKQLAHETWNWESSRFLVNFRHEKNWVCLKILLGVSWCLIHVIWNP